LRALRVDGDPERAMAAWALLGTIAVLLVVSTFDAVLLLPAPALVAWALLGALSPPSRPRAVVPISIPKRLAAILVVLAFGGLAVTRSAAQVAAMSIYSGTTRAREVEHASELDPGSYRIHLRLAEAYARRGSCTNVRAHASAARDLFPNAPAPRRFLAACGR
jgi:hypothetical protein